MTNKDILEAFITIQEKTMFSKIVSFGNYKIITNEFDKTPFWNYVFCDNKIDAIKISSLEKELEKLERIKSFYFEYNKSNDTTALIEYLTERGYVLKYEDSWMFFTSNVIETLDYSHIKKVSSGEDLDTWISVINECYKENDPQNPYGSLGSYLDLAKKAWLTNNSSDFIYYIAYKDSTPVSVATLTFQSDLGYISNVGSLQTVRGQGYGKLITLFCVEQSLKRNVKQVCLGTEEGTFPNDFYKRIGFETKFTTRNYTKKLARH